ncbi:MAG: sel1 repeat family protein [Alphaproteobacteria bacterium]|nr:sel1 repeat family protein [Alphaproteobacteria bacterium]
MRTDRGTGLRPWCLCLLLGFMVMAVAFAPPARADFAEGTRAFDAGDYARAYEIWLPLAREGDLAAQRNIGLLYQSGRGVARDTSEAARWFRRAAEAGFDRAQANLAALYLNGDGVAQDYGEARAWFEKAAMQGHVVSQYNLGVIYELGLGVGKSEPRAVAWYNLAARAGHRGALDRLSYLVALKPAGEGEAGAAAAGLRPAQAETMPVPPEGPQPPAPEVMAEVPIPPSERDVDSLTFGRAAREANGPTPQPAAAPAARAAAAAAPARASGGGDTAATPASSGAEQAFASGDYQGALARWLPAARAGNADAQFGLGRLYREGLGLPPDRVRAHMWWNLAARQGHEPAREALSRLESQMSAGQIEEAKALAEGLAPR